MAHKNFDTTDPPERNCVKHLQYAQKLRVQGTYYYYYYYYYYIVIRICIIKRSLPPNRKIMSANIPAHLQWLFE